MVTHFHAFASTAHFVILLTTSLTFGKMDLSANPGSQTAIPTAPIHRLTSTELVNIFSFLSDITNSKVLQPADTNIKPEWDWIIVTHVCRYWRTTTLECAPLWSCLTQYICANSQMLAAFIERSYNADLDVTASLPIIPEKGPLTEVLRHIGRVRSLNLYIPGYLDDGARKEIQDYLAHPALRLQEFNLTGNSVRRNISSINFPTTSPLLKRLSLTRLSMSREVPFHTVTGLVHLKLNNIEDLTSLGLLSLLKLNPTLEIVTLENIFWSTLTEASLQSLNGVTIALPKLIKLTLYHHIISFLATPKTECITGYDEILKGLDIPHQASWECNFTTKRKESLLELHLHRHLPQSYVSSECGMLKIQVFNAGFNIEYINPYPVAEGLGTKSEHPRKSQLQFNWKNNFSQTENIFTTNGIVPVLDGTLWKDTKSVQIELLSYKNFHHANATMRIHHAITMRVDEEAWIPLLLIFTSIQSIQVSDNVPNYGNIESFLNALVYQNRDGSAVQRDKLVCPSLKTLSLKLPIMEMLTEVPDSFVLALKRVLRTRKEMNLGLEILIFMTSQGTKISEHLDLASLSEFVDHIYEI